MGEQKKALILLLIICLVISTLPLVGAAEDSWTTKASMPEAIIGGKAAAVNGKIYVIGDEANFEYDPDTDTWTEKRAMPTARMFFGIAVYQNKIYAIGGRSSGISFDTNEVYDPSTNTWKTKRSMPTNMSDMEANVVDGKIHLIRTDRHYIYDIATDSWTSGKTMDFLYGYSSAVVNDKIYMIGSNQTLTYDPLSDSWNLGTSPPISVQDAGACATTGIMAPKRVYVFGGISGGSLDGKNFTQIYDPETDSWTYGASMPTERGWLEVVVVEDIIYAIAGRGCGICPVLKVNEQYTPIGYIPEFPSWIILPLLLIATIVVITYRNRLRRRG
jgi:N-acetylneuraminic acid mutarotase